MEGLYTFVYVTAMRGKYRIGEGKSELDSWESCFFKLFEVMRRQLSLAFEKWTSTTVSFLVTLQH